VAEVVVSTAIIGQEAHCVFRRDVLRVLFHEICMGMGCVSEARGVLWKVADVPRTVGHNVSIVRGYSNNEMVNPELG
jgi:hypothetical protein